MSDINPKVKLLLVDDLSANLLALEALLVSDDVEALKAHSGSEALELLLAEDIALALIDVQMPGMDGFELAELMRGTERTRHIPIIFVTAGPWEQKRIFRGYDAGAVDFLFKPIEPHILRNKVRTFAALYRQRLEIADKLAALEKSESEARSLKDELSATLKLNETFVAAVSHDLKTPLNAVLMASELLLVPGRGERDRVLVERARSSARRMANMIDQLFDLSRARLAGGIPLAIEQDVDLVTLAEQIVHELGVITPDRALNFEWQGDARGDWDPERLARVLSNLLGNAVRHSQAGTPIGLKLDGRCDQQVSFEVSNAGTIPKEILPGLFGPFSNPDRARKRGDGLGLGLFIVAQIVAAHAGRVTVRSEDGHTTFSVVLPRHVLEPRRAEEEAESLPKQRVARPASPH